MAFDLANPGFESGALTGWTLVPEDTSGLENNLGDASVGAHGVGVLSGAYSLGIWGGAPFTRGRIEQTSLLDVGVDTLEMLAYMRGTNPGGPAEPAASLWTMRWGIDWYDENNVYLSTDNGPVVRAAAEQWRSIRATFSRPQYAAKARPFLYVNKGTTLGMEALFLDEASWNNSSNFSAALQHPAHGSTYAVGQSVPLAITHTGTAPSITSVQYRANDEVLATVNSAPWSSSTVFNEEGSYNVTAVISLSDSTTVTAGPNTVNITAGGGDAREYRASNAQAPIVLGDFSGLSAAMPSTARVVGVEAILDYRLGVRGRIHDLEISDPASSTNATLFDAVLNGRVELGFLSPQGEAYNSVGNVAYANVPIREEDFTLIETAITDDKKWVVYEQEEARSVTVGADIFRFGQTDIPATNFTDSALTLVFYPEVAAKPAYADSGDASYRIMIDRVRVRVYFDAGSVVYYFASPDKSMCIKGTLVASYVLDGDLRTADAEGVMQLLPTLEIMDGSQHWIGNDWTIHAAYPPTDANYIGDVGYIEGDPVLGMEYNALPTQAQVGENRSRYLFISENFYGDPALNSMYGVHGLPRAFAYNGDFFYKIYTQADPEKDSPRHVANHHGHLALGFHGGRVDLSVVGEPYNYDGALGASSWAFGDKVVGLLPLSGTILGVFGAKSVWGISGTTVDNFATQVISPNIGAIEYTITDMGFPIYANAYGIYTLSQTQEYGDYLGTPMSKDISPWLRPRLLRKPTSDKEVVCAWPVRSKNQYRLAFSDGYVLTMTMNGNVAPTFSKQKYFLNDSDAPVLSLYEQPSIVPAAVSSELDDAGEERIHIAPKVKIETAPLPPAPSCAGVLFFSRTSVNLHDFQELPEWFDPWNNFQIYNEGYELWDFGNQTEGYWELQDMRELPPPGTSGRGMLYQSIGDGGETKEVCINWEVVWPA